MAAQDIVKLFKQVCSRLRETEQLLADARETITILETELEHVRDQGNEADAQVKMDIKLSNASTLTKPATKRDGGELWIDDVWLTTPATSRLLGDAQVAWIQNRQNPQSALTKTTMLLMRPQLNRRDRLLCILFESAVLLSIGRLNDCCARANTIIRECGRDWRLEDLRSIGHFIRGRYLLERRSYRLAFRDFSVAVFADGYRDSAKNFRDQAEAGMFYEVDGSMGSRPEHARISSLHE